LRPNDIQEFFIGQIRWKIVYVVSEYHRALLKSIKVFSGPLFVVSCTNHSNEDIEENNLGHESRTKEVEPDQVLAHLGVG